MSRASARYSCLYNAFGMRPDLSESPIEHEVAYHLFKCLARDAELDQQVWMRTANGNFRADFVVRFGGRVVVVECDGKEFHDPERDIWRDAVILGSGHADAVYRFPGFAIHSSIEHCLFAFSRCEPGAVSDRAWLNLETAARPAPPTFIFDRVIYNGTAEETLIESHLCDDECDESGCAWDPPEEPRVVRFGITRRSFGPPGTTSSDRLRSLYRVAVESGSSVEALAADMPPRLPGPADFAPRCFFGARRPQHPANRGTASMEDCAVDLSDLIAAIVANEESKR